MLICYEIVNSRLQHVKVMEQDHVIRTLEDTFREYELKITQKSTLSTLKGCIHYHLKQGQSRGVLEVTYWPQKSRLWAEIHNNRRAEWNENMISNFAERLAQLFGGEARC